LVSRTLGTSLEKMEILLEGTTKMHKIVIPGEEEGGG
jgi:hypothetical protein